MQILEIYKKHKIAPQLQLHMLRVSAVASLICDNFTKPIDKSLIVSACLLHDLGNIVKFDFENFDDSWFAPRGKTYWKKNQSMVIKKYGDDDHKVTESMIREIKVDGEILNLVDKIGFSNSFKIFGSSDFNLKILSYADLRVSPYGIVSMKERYKEARKRYLRKKSNKYTPEEFYKLIEINKKNEKEIITHCKISPSEITEKSAAPIIYALRSFDIPTGS